MAAEVNVIVNAVDNFSSTLGNFGNIITGIKSAVDLLAGAFDAVSDAVQPFIDSASDSEVAISAFDTVLRSTSVGAGIFQETVGQLSNRELTGLYDRLEQAKGRLEEMREEFGNVRTYTEQETIAIAAQREEIASLTAQIERGTNGLTILRDTTQLTRDQMLELAAAIQRVTQYSDEEVLAAESMMLRFENVNSTIFPQAIRLATDLAQSLGIDLTAAARSIGMALDDPEQGIGRLNTAFRIFNETEMETIKNMAANGDIAGAQALIIQALTEKVGGAAEAYGRTFAGALDIATNKLDDFRELIGGPIIFLLGELLDKVMEFADTNPTIRSVISFFTELNDLLQTPDVPFLSALGAALLHVQDTGVLNDLGGVLLALQGNITLGMDPFTALALGLETLADKWEGTAAGDIVGRLQEFIETWQQQGFGTAAGGLFTDLWTGLMDYTSSPEFRGNMQALIDRMGEVLGSTDFRSIAEVIARVINTALTIALNSLDAVINGVNWAPVGTALRNALSEIWQGFQDANDTGGSGGNTNLYSIAVGIGEDIGDGMRAGLIAAWQSNPIGDWIYDHIIEPVRRVLGISSPSTVFFSIGQDIVRGLLAGINSLFGGVLDIFDSILNLFGIGGTGGTSTGIGGGTVGSGAGDTGHTRGGIVPAPTAGMGGNTLIFYGPVYVGSIDQLMYDCAQTNPLLQAGSSFATSGI